MTGGEPDAYLAERIRSAVATELGQLGLVVEVEGDLVIVRGRVDAEPLRGRVVRMAGHLSGGRRVVDEMERPRTRSDGGAEPERIEP